MTTCPTVSKETLTDPVNLYLHDRQLTFDEAKRIAEERAREIASDPMLLGWYDRKTGRFSPEVECCSEYKPGWVVYSETRGGDITININDEEYVFIFADLPI